MSRDSLAMQVQEVLERKAKVSVRSGVALLREKKRRRTVMQVELVAVPDGATVINVEKLGELSGVRGQFRSRCDYLVLFRKTGADAAVFVELKKTLQEGSKGLEQLRKSPAYLDYLKTIYSIHFDDDAEPSRRMAIRYLLVGERATKLLAMGRVSDPQTLRDEEHRGITVGRVVGNRLHFDRLRGLVA